MRFSVDIILGVLSNPRWAVEKIIKLRLSEIIILQATLFVAICSTILTYFFLQIISNQVADRVYDANNLLDEIVSYISLIQPIYFTANQVFQMLIFSVIITFGGKIFNGKGKFFEALICINVVEAVLTLLKLVQLILVPFSAVLAFVVIIPGVLWSLWAFASSAAFIHGFKSTLLTFCGGFILCLLFLISLNIVF